MGQGFEMFLFGRASALFIATWQIGGLQFAAAQSPPAQDALRTATSIASEQYRAAGREDVITLWRQDIPRMSELGLLGYFKQHPEQTSFPNTAFLLIVSDPRNPKQGRVVWVTYIYNDKLIRPQETWMADLARPISGNQTHVVLVKSIGWDAEFFVYGVSLDKNLGSFPVNLDPANFEGWPPAAHPLSSYRKTLLAREISGIREIHVEADSRGLTIHGKRDLESTPPVVFHFDTEAKQWSQVDQ